MDAEDKDDGYAEWQRSDYTKFVLKGYVARAQSLFKEQHGQILSHKDDDAKVTAGRIAEVQYLLKVLGGGK